MVKSDEVHHERAAIVTGASSGIGLGITQALLERGYRVVANSRTISKSRDLKPSENLVLVEGDIGEHETAVKAVGAAVKHFGRLDLLVNNAGIFFTKPFTDYTVKDITDAVIYLTDAATVTGHILYVDGGAHFDHW